MMRWVYQRGVTSFDEMTDLSLGLRSRLAESFDLVRPSLVERQVSQVDGTRKYLWRLSDGTHVESVGLPSRGRLTVCFSTQAGCGMGCAFCATGEGGLARSLSAGEMALQVALVAADFETRASNAVAMGQGEPFANYSATLGGLRLMNSADGLGIGARHLTVSTCGLIEGIRGFTEEPEQFTLAVSLHSAVQATRDLLMPGVAGQPLRSLRAALVEYSARTGRRPSLEYALIAGVNDTEPQTEALVGFCRGLLCHVNLIPANPVGRIDVRKPDTRAVEEIARRLESAGVEATVRTERGTDIDAACGQLRQRRRPRS